MKKITKRIRITDKIEYFLNHFKLKKQRFIELAIIEKIERDYPEAYRSIFLSQTLQ
jgi:hypothetical protein